MKAHTFFAVAALVLTSSAAQASTTWTCESQESNLKIRVNESVMVLSDPTIGSGRKTIARFTADNGVLETRDHGDAGTRFVADVDLRFNDSARAGEYLLGTRLGEIDTVTVYVGNADGDAGEGRVSIRKRNGTRASEAITCW